MGHVVPSWVTLSTKDKEARRLAAARDLLDGMPQVEVATKYGVKRQTVHIWKKWLDKKGLDGLTSRPRSGRPTKLNEEQCRALVEVLLKGPREQGFRTDAWNSRRVQRVIEQAFGVEYHVNHVPRLLRSLGFRPRKPDRQALEKDEAAKQAWLETTWEYCKKNSSPAGRSSSSTKQVIR